MKAWRGAEGGKGEAHEEVPAIGQGKTMVATRAQTVQVGSSGVSMRLESDSHYLLID